MSDRFEIIVVGAGPCGIAVGAAAKKAGLSCVLFDKGCITSSIVGYPYYMTSAGSRCGWRLPGAACSGSQLRLSPGGVTGLTSDSESPPSLHARLFWAADGGRTADGVRSRSAIFLKWNRVAPLVVGEVWIG